LNHDGQFSVAIFVAMLTGVRSVEKVLSESFLKLRGDLDDVADVCVLNARHNLPTACENRVDTDYFVFKHRLKLFHAKFVSGSLNELPDNDYFGCFNTEFLATLGEFFSLASSTPSK
jgi:hypothetical protein